MILCMSLIVYVDRALIFHGKCTEIFSPLLFCFSYWWRIAKYLANKAQLSVCGVCWASSHYFLCHCWQIYTLTPSRAGLVYSRFLVMENIWKWKTHIRFYSLVKTLNEMHLIKIFSILIMIIFHEYFFRKYIFNYTRFFLYIYIYIHHRNNLNIA